MTIKIEVAYLVFGGVDLSNRKATMSIGMLAVGIVFFIGPFFRTRAAAKMDADSRKPTQIFAQYYCLAFFALVLVSDLLPMTAGSSSVPYAEALGHAAYWLAAFAALGEAIVRRYNLYLDPVLDKGEGRSEH